MSIRTLVAIVLFTCAAAFYQAPALASAADGSACYDAAEKVDAGEALSPTEKEEAHQACRRAIEATGSIVQKYQFEEADFTITGKRHKY